MAVDKDAFKDFIKTTGEMKKANSQAYDKAILSLSSAGFALSLSFHSTIVPIPEADCVVLLKTSWILFLASVIATVVSFRLANMALDNTTSYFTQKFFSDDNNVKEKNGARNLLTVLEWVGGACFVLALVSLLAYVIQNV